MKVGEVRIAEDKDFERFKQLVENHDGWKLEYDKGQTKVWTKPTEQTSFKMMKLRSFYKDVKASVLTDVLHDPEYRKLWDNYMLESYDIGYLNPNNDIGYYSVQSPTPMKNRDFVLQRSWLDTEKEHIIINHSVFHQSVPLKENYVRAISFLTGFLVRPREGGCDFGYVTQSDPKGFLPVWIVNKMTQLMAPKMAKRLWKACQGYEAWKNVHNPKFKPWIYPDQLSIPKITISECLTEDLNKSRESLDDESCMDENSFKDVEDDGRAHSR